MNNSIICLILTYITTKNPIFVFCVIKLNVALWQKYSDLCIFYMLTILNNYYWKCRVYEMFLSQMNANLTF
jgi:hypothetical protein